MSARPPVSLGVHIPEDQIKALAEAVKPSGDELAKLVYAIAEAVASKLSPRMQSAARWALAAAWMTRRLSSSSLEIQFWI